MSTNGTNGTPQPFEAVDPITTAPKKRRGRKAKGETKRFTFHDVIHGQPGPMAPGRQVWHLDGDDRDAALAAGERTIPKGREFIMLQDGDPLSAYFSWGRG